MHIVLVIWSTGKKQALNIYGSNLLFISYCWNFIFISSCLMAKLHDGRDNKMAFSQLHPAQPWEKMNIQLVVPLLLSLCHLVFYAFWASVSVIEVVVVQMLKWLLTLGFISLIFLIFFFFNCYFPNTIFFYYTALWPSYTYMYTFYFFTFSCSIVSDWT